MKSNCHPLVMERVAARWGQSVARMLAIGAFAVLTFPNLGDADSSPGPLSDQPGDHRGCPPAEDILEVVQSRYDDIDDLSARFAQETRSVVLAGSDDRETSRGKVLLAKPGRMRWAYGEPEPSFVISDGKTVWIHDVAAAQVTRMPMGEGYLAGAALDFLFGEGRIEESFRASTVECAAGQTRVELLPREPASYEKLSLTVRPGDGLVTATSITDLFGNRTEIRFSDIRLNQAPAPGEFRFELPDGAELIDLAPTP